MASLRPRKNDRKCSKCGKQGLHWRYVQGLTGDRYPRWVLAEGDANAPKPERMHAHWPNNELIPDDHYKVLPYPVEDEVAKLKIAMNAADVTELRRISENVLKPIGITVSATYHVQPKSSPERSAANIIFPAGTPPYHTFKGKVQATSAVSRWLIGARNAKFTELINQNAYEFELHEKEFYELMQVCLDQPRSNDAEVESRRYVLTGDVYFQHGTEFSIREAPDDPIIFADTDPDLNEDISFSE